MIESSISSFFLCHLGICLDKTSHRIVSKCAILGEQSVLAKGRYLYAVLLITPMSYCRRRSGGNWHYLLSNMITNYLNLPRLLHAILYFLNVQSEAH